MTEKHSMIKKATKDELEIANWCADWLLDSIACAGQDRSFLRGDPEYNEYTGASVLNNGVIACLHAIEKYKETQQ